jgi:hypothetical protein
MLSFPARPRALVAPDARLACYSAIVGLLALVSTVEELHTLERWWTAFVPDLVHGISDREHATVDEKEILTALLLWAVYRRDALPVGLQKPLDSLLSRTLAESFGEGMETAEREFQSIWRTVGAGCVGIGFEALAEQIAKLVGPDHESGQEAPWRTRNLFFGAPLWSDTFTPPFLLPGIEPPSWRSDHDVYSNREAFLALSRT